MSGQPADYQQQRWLEAYLSSPEYYSHIQTILSSQKAIDMETRDNCVQQLQGQIQSLKQLVERQKAETEHLKEGLNPKDDQIKQLSEKLSGERAAFLAKELEWKSDKSDLEKVVREKNKNYDDLLATIEADTKEIVSLKKEKDVLVQMLHQSDSKNEVMKKRLDEMKLELAAVTNQLHQKNDQLEQRNDQLEQRNGQLEQQSDQLLQQNEDLQARTTEISQLMVVNAQLQHDNDELRSHLSSLLNPVGNLTNSSTHCLRSSDGPPEYHKIHTLSTDSRSTAVNKDYGTSFADVFRENIYLRGEMGRLEQQLKSSSPFSINSSHLQQQPQFGTGISQEEYSTLTQQLLDSRMENDQLQSQHRQLKSQFDKEKGQLNEEKSKLDKEKSELDKEKGELKVENEKLKSDYETERRLRLMLIDRKKLQEPTGSISPTKQAVTTPLPQTYQLTQPSPPAQAQQHRQYQQPNTNTRSGNANSYTNIYTTPSRNSKTPTSEGIFPASKSHANHLTKNWSCPRCSHENPGNVSVCESCP